MVRSPRAGPTLQAIFQMDFASAQHEGQWQLLYLLGTREQLAMYHPSGFNTYLVLPNLAPLCVPRPYGGGAAWDWLF